jgi:hypothetical protein
MVRLVATLIRWIADTTHFEQHNIQHLIFLSMTESRSDIPAVSTFFLCGLGLWDMVASSGAIQLNKVMISLPYARKWSAASAINSCPYSSVGDFNNIPFFS